jgi:hypothetical protein
LGGTGVGGSVGAGGWVAGAVAGVVAVGAGPHALSVSTTTNNRVKNMDFLFIIYSSGFLRIERVLHI